ncbi:MAG: hypothetical protein ACF8R7_13045 [Phycisphaerales bacterium JB039]
MLFIHPMWDNESQRIGMQKCTPVGYAIHGTAELIGFVGLLLLLLTLAMWGWRWLTGTFRAALLLWSAAPFALGVLSEVMVWYSWRMARKRGFQYDYDRREASWMEAGERCTYTYSQTDDGG